MTIEQIIKYLPAPICGYTDIGKEKQKEYQAHDSAVIILRKYQKITEIVKARKMEEKRLLDEIRADIISYEGDCRLSVDEYPSCKQCTDNVFESIYAILDKCKAESEKTI